MCRPIVLVLGCTLAACAGTHQTPARTPASSTATGTATATAAPSAAPPAASDAAPPNVALPHLQASFPIEQSCKEVTDRPNERSLPLYEKGCEGGDVRGCQQACIGHLCAFGTPRDIPRAASFADHACQLGAAPACGNAGALFLQLGDTEHGVKALRRGCDADDIPSCNNLGSYYMLKGTPDDMKHAVELFDRLCARSNEPSCANLAQLLLIGAGTAKNLPRARTLAERTCTEKIGVGCNVLGMLLVDGSDVKPAIDAFDQACNLGAPAACDNLAQLYLGTHGQPVDRARAASYFHRACDMGWAHACTQLGELTP